MKTFIQSALPVLSLLSSVAYAQTWTSCNPLNSTCPADTALGVANYTIDFTSSMMSSRVWNATAGSVKYGDDGAQFIINQKGDSPTVQSNFHLFFGQVEVIMKAASGQGIVSSIVMESDDLDEVDWELIGGNNSFVETNYFGKGNTTSYDRAIWYPIENPQGIFHNYTIDWSAEKLDWYVDGQIIRTLLYADANGGKNFPQTPCDVRLGIWAGGDPVNNNGTIEWAGGLTDYNKAPFTMTVKSVRVSDASRGTQYVYGDHSGSYESIQITNTTAALQLDGANGSSTTQTATQKWKSLSSGAKIAIACSVGGAFVAAIGVFAICCIKQRRAGKHEKLIEDAKFEKERTELMAYRAEMGRMRNEKMVMQNGMVSPVGMGMAGATLYAPLPGQQGARSISGGSSGGYSQGYPQSTMSSMNSMHSGGRGYQRY